MKIMNDSSELGNQPIKGAVPQADAAELAALWRDCLYLRPCDHSEWLRHLINLDLNLARLQAGWVPAVGKLEWKLEIPRIVFEDMQHVHRLKERLDELPKPNRSLQDTPKEVAAFINAIGPAEHAATFYRVLFTVIKPAVAGAYEEYIRRCDEVLDGPVLFTLRSVVSEKRRQLEQFVAFSRLCPVYTDSPEVGETYERHVQACLLRLGSLTPHFNGGAIYPENPVTAPAGPSPARTVHDPELNLTGKDEFPRDRARNPVGYTLQEIIYHNATEWQVVGPMCSVFHDAPRTMPIEFYIDFSRHIWDECRHAQMGLRRLEELGYKRSDFWFPNGGDKPTSPEDYVATLTLVGEACSFNRKRGSIVPFLRQKDFRSAMLPEADCNDEQNHVRYGYRWVPELYLRARNDSRTIKQISDQVRQDFMGGLERIKNANEEERKALFANLPTLCSLIEFPDLDFTTNASAPAKREPQS
jgi:hypothetical protein